MKVKIFGSFVKDYEEQADQWLTENKDLNIKHVAIALNQPGDWILTSVFYAEKDISVENG